MKKKSRFNLSLLAAAMAAAFIAAGCAPSFTTVSTPSAGTIPAADAKPLKVAAEAGIPLEDPAAVPVAAAPAPAPGAPGAAASPVASAKPDIFSVARAMSFGARANPFALLGSEVSFDRLQTAARIIDETGGWRSDFVPQPDVQEDAVKEQIAIPNWRLAGVIVGDAVVALLDMGTTVVEIRPGAAIPETEWVCISIDNESAVLRHRRDVQPKEITIFLAAQIFGTPAVGGGLGDGVGGSGGPGMPGAPGSPDGDPSGAGRGGRFGSPGGNGSEK